MRFETKTTLAAAVFFGLVHAGSAGADSGIVGTIDARPLKPHGALVMTTQPNPALVRLMKAGLSGQQLRSLAIAADGKVIRLRDVTVAGWTAASESSVEVTLEYERAEF